MDQLPPNTPEPQIVEDDENKEADPEPVTDHPAQHQRNQRINPPAQHTGSPATANLPQPYPRASQDVQQSLRSSMPSGAQGPGLNDPTATRGLNIAGWTQAPCYGVPSHTDRNSGLGGMPAFAPDFASMIGRQRNEFLPQQIQFSPPSRPQSTSRNVGDTSSANFPANTSSNSSSMFQPTGLQQNDNSAAQDPRFQTTGVFGPRSDSGNASGVLSVAQYPMPNDSFDVGGNDLGSLYRASRLRRHETHLSSNIATAPPHHWVQSAAQPFANQPVYTSAQTSHGHNNFSTNNGPHDHHPAEYNQTMTSQTQGSQPRNNGGVQTGYNPFRQNEHTNEIGQTFQYVRGPHNALSGPRSVVPDQGRNRNDPSHPPQYAPTSTETQSGAHYEHVNENAQFSQPQTRISANSLRSVQSDGRHRPFDFSGQISRPMDDFQAEHWPSPPPPEQEQYAQQNMGHDVGDEDDGSMHWELSEDEEAQSPPKKDLKKKRKSTRGPLVDAPHAALQAPDCDLTASDIFCLFPRYYLRRALMKRFVNNGWQAKDIADAINYSRGVACKHQMIYNGSMKAVKKQMQRDQEDETPDGNMRVSSTDLPARTQTELANNRITLYDLGARVRCGPRGRFLTPVMQAVKWCWDNQDITTTLEQLPALIARLGFQMPAQLPGTNHDQEYRAWIKHHFGKNHAPCPECTPR